MGIIVFLYRNVIIGLGLIVLCSVLSIAQASSPGNVTFGTPTSPNTSAVFDSTGTFVLQMAVFDGAKTSTASVTITVLAQNVFPNIAIGNTSGVIAGNTWGVSATLSTGTSNIASLQFDAILPPGASTATVVAGAASLVAGKTVTANAIAGGIRVLVFGVNQTIIGSGVVAILNLQTDPTLLAGTLVIPISNIVMSDPLGVNVPATGTNGSLMVTANKAPVVTIGANQTITLPALANLTSSATDDGAPNPPGLLTYGWSVR